MVSSTSGVSASQSMRPWINWCWVTPRSPVRCAVTRSQCVLGGGDVEGDRLTAVLAGHRVGGDVVAQGGQLGVLGV